MTPKAQWADRRMRLRRNITTILERLRSGEIEDFEFDQLYNFAQVMLMLLSKVSPGTLDAAMKEAEIAAWLTGGVIEITEEIE